MCDKMDYSNAKAYSALNKPQYDIGYEFIRSLNFTPGDKVLDMGCGTGELSKVIADIVGLGGEVVGVDPDEARVKLAQEKFKDVLNIKFLVGSSVIGFPHDNEQYYDVHFSSNVFHWMIGDEKKIYLEKAYRCLKPGGKMAILAGMRQDEDVAPKTAIEFLCKTEYEKLFQDVGIFSDVTLEMASHFTQFANYDEFCAWFKATFHLDLTEFDQEFLKGAMPKYTKTAPDGTFLLEQSAVRITGYKRR